MVVCVVCGVARHEENLRERCCWKRSKRGGYLAKKALQVMLLGSCMLVQSIDHLALFVHNETFLMSKHVFETLQG